MKAIGPRARILLISTAMACFSGWLVPTAQAIEDWYGIQGAISGHTAVVGQRSGTSGFGDAVVHVWSGGADPGDWPEQQRLASLVAGQVAEGAEFGAGALAIDGDTILVGAYRDSDMFQEEAGTAFVFTRSGSVWTRQARLTAPGPATANAQFGAAGDLSGNRALVTAAGTNEAFLFTRTGTTWNNGVALTGGTINGPFAAAIDGDVAVVGSITGDAHADIWRYSSGVWNFEATLANPGNVDNLFASSLSLSGDTLVIGAREQNMQVPDPPGPPTDVLSAGAAYVYRYTGSSWTLEQTILNPDPVAGDWFGYEVAIDGDQLLIGAPRDDGLGDDAGRAYLYEWTGSAWQSAGPALTDNNPAAGKWYGEIVALDDENWLAGGPGRGLDPAGQGDVDFQAAGTPVWPPGDANKDGVVDEKDAAILAAHWLTSGGVAWGDGDFNADDHVDDLDLAILAANWSPGGGAAVPEPSTLAGVVALALAVAAWRRRTG
ncbi:MAG: PEP-CTERM sorting domain-containing protein [Pirellulales bacterium]|nr:PEP-CTERM sorting domain-containing protein [Pirellulales bacterium]